MRIMVEFPDRPLSASDLFVRLKKLARVYHDAYGWSERSFDSIGDGEVLEMKASGSGGTLCGKCDHPVLVAEAVQFAHDIMSAFLSVEDVI